MAAASGGGGWSPRRKPDLVRLQEDKLKMLEKVVEEAEEAKAAAYDPLAHKSLEELKELEVRACGPS